MLAFIECKNELHEPSADTAEETEADLPATETATALKFPGLWGLVSGFPGLVTV
jgi:hypothetical protein